MRKGNRGIVIHKIYNVLWNLQNRGIGVDISSIFCVLNVVIKQENSFQVARILSCLTVHLVRNFEIIKQKTDCLECETEFTQIF